MPTTTFTLKSGFYRTNLGGAYFPEQTPFFSTVGYDGFSVTGLLPYKNKIYKVNGGLDNLGDYDQGDNVYWWHS